MIEPDPHATANAFIEAAFSIDPNMPLDWILYKQPAFDLVRGRWERAVTGSRPKDKVHMVVEVDDVGLPTSVRVFARCPDADDLKSTEGSIAGQLNARLGTGIREPEVDGLRVRSWRLSETERVRFWRKQILEGDQTLTSFAFFRTFDRQGGAA